MDKISVNLYGGRNLFGRKESPLRAEEVYCDIHATCSLFKHGCCLNVTSPFSGSCKFGKVTKITGYTSRARKYSDFKDKYQADEKYGKLTHPSDCAIALMDDYIYLNVTFARINYENDTYSVDNVGFCSSASWIRLADFNLDLLYNICTYKPQALMGGEITAYKIEQIPNMLQELKLLLPALYTEFIKKYPDFDLTPNYIGKYAFIHTLAKGSILTDCHGNKFRFDGEYLICERWKLCFVPFEAGVAEMKIKVTDTMQYTIDDNSQVAEYTLFKQ